MKKLLKKIKESESFVYMANLKWWQRIIVFWWILSFCILFFEGPILAIIANVANFAISSLCLIKFVPISEDK